MTRVGDERQAARHDPADHFGEHVSRDQHQGDDQTPAAGPPQVVSVVMTPVAVPGVIIVVVARVVPVFIPGVVMMVVPGMVVVAVA